MTEIWSELLLRPVLNGLIIFYTVLANNFGLSILAVTIVMRLITLPLTLKQVRQTKVMSLLSPKLQELQKKHGKDRQKLTQEQMKLYREMGVSPLGCILPMLVQLPIWVALYQSIMRALAATPEYLLGLSQFLYKWSSVHHAIPLNPNFLWLDLGQPDRLFIMPVLVGISTWVQNKMMASPTVDPRQMSQAKMMNWMMPLMMTWITLTLPSGLGLYWVASNIIGVSIQYFVTGWGSLRLPAMLRQPDQSTAKAITPAAAEDDSKASPAEREKRPEHAKGTRVQRQDRRGSDRDSSGRAQR